MAELMDAARVARTLDRMAHEIVERHPNLASAALIGVRSRGVPLAHRLARLVKQASGVDLPVGALDISLYRDDFTNIAPQPVTKGTAIPFTIDGRSVIIVDDVLFTGRTVRAALDQLIDFGRPARIELAVLVDRGHRELPIRADYVGKTVATSLAQTVQVRVREQDGDDGVDLDERAISPLPPPGKPLAKAKPLTKAKPSAKARGKTRSKTPVRRPR
jgi:pyrimidine operon attenuation protein/uracil phosphoribosyltransferase